MVIHKHHHHQYYEEEPLHYVCNIIIVIIGLAASLYLYYTSVSISSMLSQYYPLLFYCKKDL